MSDARPPEGRDPGGRPPAQPAGASGPPAARDADGAGGAGGASALPARRPIDRAALDRVLARAAELQIDAGMPAEGALTEEQLVELGREVGLAPEYLRQAISEERTRVAAPAESGVMGRVFGSSVASAMRVVPGNPEQVLAALDRWMDKEECLQVKRRFTDRIVWEARRDIVGSIRRGFNIGGRGYHLSRADDVAATVLPAEPGRSMVRLDATLGDARGQRVAGSVGTLAGGAAVTGVFAVLGVMLPVALIPAIVALPGAWLIARGHSETVHRAQLALEQVLDRLEYGELEARSQSLLSMLNPPRRRL